MSISCNERAPNDLPADMENIIHKTGKKLIMKVGFSKYRFNPGV